MTLKLIFYLLHERFAVDEFADENDNHKTIMSKVNVFVFLSIENLLGDRSAGAAAGDSGRLFVAAQLKNVVDEAKRKLKLIFGRHRHGAIDARIGNIRDALLIVRRLILSAHLGEEHRIDNALLLNVEAAAERSEDAFAPMRRNVFHRFGEEA